MAQVADFLHRKNYGLHRGLDLKSTDLTRQANFASAILNGQLKRNGGPEKRKGNQAHAATAGGNGAFTYHRTNPETGVLEPQVLSIGESLLKKNLSTITVAYVGVDPNARLDLFYDTVSAQYRCQLTEGDILVLDFPLGLGFDEAAPVTVNQLSAAIDALAGFTAVVAGATTTPAAFCKIVREHDLSSTGSALALEAAYWSTVTETETHPFSAVESSRNAADFEPVSAAELNNVIYFGSGYTDVMKYDGQAVYRAGFRTSNVSVVSTPGAAGNPNGTNFQHVIQFLHIDAAGNFVYSNELYGNVFNAALQKIGVVVSPYPGFNGQHGARGAIVNGNQTSGSTTPTLTVDAGHTFQIGDVAYLQNQFGTPTYTTRKITAVGATSITLELGVPVWVNDNQVISNNFRMLVYRSQNSGGTPTAWYLVEEVPFDPFSNNQTYTDDIDDAGLTEQLEIPAVDLSAPPSFARYVSAWRGQLFVGGIRTDMNTLAWGDIEHQEGFPSDANGLDMSTKDGTQISGIAPQDDEFLIFKNRGILGVSGDLLTGALRRRDITNNLGCLAHASIQEIKGIVVFCSELGPYQIRGGGAPAPLGGDAVMGCRIEPVFTDEQVGLLPAELLRFKRMTSVHDVAQEKYILFIPAETTTGGQRHANSSSRTFCYDYSHDAWFEWDWLNMASGVALDGDELYFMESRYSVFAGAVQHVMYRRHTLNDGWAYEDNNQAISWRWLPQWEAMGEPSVLKKFLDIKAFFHDITPNSDAILSLSTNINYIPDAPHTQTTLQAEGAGYGEGPFSLEPYGNPSGQTDEARLARGRVRALQLVWENAEHQVNVDLMGWELQIAAPYGRVFKP